MACPVQAGHATKDHYLPGRNEENPMNLEDLERAGGRHLAGHRILRAGAGCRRRQDLVQQMPRLPRDRRRRQEQGRPRAQRPRRPPFRHRAGLQLFDDANKNSGITWNKDTVPRIHQGSEGQDPRHQDGVRRHQERDRGQQPVGLRVAVRQGRASRSSNRRIGRRSALARAGADAAAFSAAAGWSWRDRPPRRRGRSSRRAAPTG